MNALLAFLTRHESVTAPIPRQWAEASDLFVMFTLATLFFLLGAFATGAWIIWRRTTRPQPHIQLLMELQETPEEEQKRDTAAAGHENEAPPAPWEKPENWWKKGSGE